MAKTKEIHSDDTKPGQPDDIVMPELDEVFQRTQEIIKPTEEQLNKQYADALAFNEEPVAFRIEPSSEENPPLYYDCWVNSKGCEIWDTKMRQWIPTGAFPVGVVVVTRRKYLEALAFAKRINVRTQVVNPTAERPENRVLRTVSQRASFSIVHDRNPKGAAWIRSLFAVSA